MNGLLDHIQDERLEPGDQLPSERQLMEVFRVGRPAVREALQNLERLGFVTITHGERARIAKLDFSGIFEQMGLTTQHLLERSEKMMADMKDARLLFERQMARRAAELASAEDVAALADALRLQRDARDANDAARFMRHDMAFHTRLASVGGNAIYPAVSEAILTWLQKFYIEQLRVAGSEDLTLSEHAAILAAVEGHDADAAEAALSAHLQRSNALYQRYIDRRGEG